MIEVENLIKVYKRGKIEVIAIRDISLRIDNKDFIALLGPSGSGKTTFLHLLAGIDYPTAGKIIVDGEDITRFNEKKLIEYRRNKIGMVFQFFNLIPTLNALENVMLPMKFAGWKKEEARRRAENLLELVGLKNRMKHYPDEMSGGEQQRVAIAIALANDPPIILADEPTGELDTETGEQIVGIFKFLNEEGKTIVIATHDERIASLAKRRLKMVDGKIIS